MTEQRLPGGMVTPVVRVGDTVRRRPPKDAEFAHALLDWFERHGWGGAPRFLGTDERGREVLSFVDGHAVCPRRLRLGARTSRRARRSPRVGCAR